MTLSSKFFFEPADRPGPGGSKGNRELDEKVSHHADLCAKFGPESPEVKKFLEANIEDAEFTRLAKGGSFLFKIAKSRGNQNEKKDKNGCHAHSDG